MRRCGNCEKGVRGSGERASKRNDRRESKCKRRMINANEYTPHHNLTHAATQAATHCKANILWR